ncbi:putative apoptosis inhibitor 5 [Apostichopus japonicus]|uniref:Putative apoptosis inhibitor 5 n=1 Tax=Stichopus japonicus TaxID=307972 RepID=A0A2G8JPX5_STIJA|nr:putative apoptosis inhibitor 5 [Apostichopus japonicus]
MATVEQLYKDYGILADAKDKAGEHEAAYNSILSAVDGGSSEKRLAAQFIPKFFKHFPSLSEKAIHAQLDLCEDEDSSIRRQAIKELPNLCRASPDNHFHIADVLTQLLQSDDPQDTSTVNSALMALFKLDAESLIRRHWEEFISFMKILSGTKTMQSLQGRQQLVELVVEQADFQSDFIASEPDLVDRLTQCLKQAVPLFSKNVPSTQFVLYLCEKVIPVLEEIKPAVTEKKSNGAKEGETEEGKEEEKKEGEEEEAKEDGDKESPEAEEKEEEEKEKKKMRNNRQWYLQKKGKKTGVVHTWKF